jgi:hypothetical protein
MQPRNISGLANMNPLLFRSVDSLNHYIWIVENGSFLQCDKALVTKYQAFAVFLETKAVRRNSSLVAQKVQFV